MKTADPYYFSAEWKALRARCLARDHRRCVFCGEPAVVADHVVSRRNGGADALSNLRSLCRVCDNRVKESSRGRRARSGDAGVVGADGWPIARGGRPMGEGV